MNNKKIALPTSASFLVSEDCNLACKYCFELGSHKQKYMSKEVARKALDFLSDNAIKDNTGHFSAMLFGGEPLINPDTVEEIFSYGLKVAREKNLRFTCSMVTNATILTPKVEKILRTYKDAVDLSVQLSVDGIKEIHDNYRVTKAGKGSFDVIEKNIPKWKDIFKDKLYSISLHGCSNHDTLPYLFENYKFFREEWNIPRIWFMPIHSEEWDDKDLEIYEEQLRLIKDYIMDITEKTGDYQEVLNYAPIDRCLSHPSFPLAPCSAGKNYITITASGEFYPCHQIYFKDPKKITKIGDLDSGIDELSRALFANYDNSDLSCAKLDPDCDAYACYRCVGENWGQNGSILSTVDCGGIRCKMSKIERKIQVEVREELEKMGLINRYKEDDKNYKTGNNPANPACLCDARGIDIYKNESEDHECKCGSNDSSCKSANQLDNELLTESLLTIIKELDKLNAGQEYILKKILD